MPKLAGITANAAQSSSQLIAPSSYEQYLPLVAPSDVAVTDGYTAIADENNVYVFDRAAGVYRRYEHRDKVTKLQFDSANKLYVLDASTHLYTLNPSSLEATNTGFVCSNFLISGNDVYFTNTSNNNSRIEKVSLHDLNGVSKKLNGLDQLKSIPALAFYNGELYFTTGDGFDARLRKFNPKTNGIANVADFPAEFLSMTIRNDVLSCVLKNGEFGVYNLNELTETGDSAASTPLFKASGKFSAVSLHGDYVYAIENKIVRQYSSNDCAFTDYEIGAKSDSFNRFDNAADVYLSDELLFIADNGNERISVYDTEQNTFLTSVETDFAPTYLASDGETLLAANADTAVLYDLSSDHYGKQLSSYATFNGNVQGVASVYGTYYFVTDKNQFLSLSETQTGWEMTTTQKSETKYPTLLAADPYGKLYVACSNALYVYSETEFLSPTTLGKEVCSTLPTQTEKISFDYRSNLYALQDNVLYRYQMQNGAYAQTSTYNMKKNEVYGITPQTASFALSIKENQTYVLYKNNYLVCRSDLNLPTLKNISVDGADARIFTNDPIPFTAVTVQSGSLMVAFDFNRLQGANVFPYLSYQWETENVTALKIGSVDVYDLLAVYDENAKTYRTYLVYTSSCQPLSTDVYQTIYAETEQKTAYLTNALSLYKLPYLTDKLTICDLPRGAQITLLGEISRLDRAYYYVSYTDENGNTQTGYVPQSYVTPTSGHLTPNDTPVGAPTSDIGAIGRMIYLLLSFGVICVLVDYLILRKPKDDQKEDNATEEHTER